MLTLLLLIVPLLASLAVLAFRQNGVKYLALGASGLELLLCIYAFIVFRNHPEAALFQFNADWIPDLGIHFSIAMDGISILLVLLTTLLMPFVVLSTLKSNYSNAFYALLFAMQMALVGVFTSMDGFLFYIFWELALIPIYFICLLWGDENRAPVTFKFFVYTLSGSLLMLVALVYLYLHTPNHSFDIQSIYAAGKSLSATEQGWVFWGFFVAFAIKMPVFPFHTWQPDTYTSSPTAGTMLLSGIMLKMGTYGLIRWLLPVVPLGWHDWGQTAIILSVVSIVYASCIAIVQKDFKRLIAYSSIAHVGLISAGILTFTEEGLQGGLFQMVSHGINVIGLFFIADLIGERMKTRQIAELGGIRNVAPVFALLFLLVLLGSVALPLTNGFVGEFLLILGLYGYNAWFAAFAGLTVILGAVYMLRSYQQMILGESNSLTVQFAEVTGNEKWFLIPIVILIFVLGVYPNIFLDVAAPAIKSLVVQYHSAIPG